MWRGNIKGLSGPQGQTAGKRVGERAPEEEPGPRLQPAVALRRPGSLLRRCAGAREGNLGHHRTCQERPGKAEKAGKEEEEKVELVSVLWWSEGPDGVITAVIGVITPCSGFLTSSWLVPAAARRLCPMGFFPCAATFDLLFLRLFLRSSIAPFDPSLLPEGSNSCWRRGRGMRRRRRRWWKRWRMSGSSASTLLLPFPPYDFIHLTFSAGFSWLVVVFFSF